MRVGRSGREGGRGAYDIAHEQEDAQVVGEAEALDALVDVFGMETVVPQTVGALGW